MAFQTPAPSWQAPTQINHALQATGGNQQHHQQHQQAQQHQLHQQQQQQQQHARFLNGAAYPAVSSSTAYPSAPSPAPARPPTVNGYHTHPTTPSQQPRPSLFPPPRPPSSANGHGAPNNIHSAEMTNLLLAVNKLHDDMHAFSDVPLNQFDPSFFPVDPRTGQQLSEKLVRGLMGKFERAESSAMDLKLYRVWMEAVLRAKAEKSMRPLPASLDLDHQGSNGLQNGFRHQGQMANGAGAYSNPGTPMGGHPGHSGSLSPAVSHTIPSRPNAMGPPMGLQRPPSAQSRNGAPSPSAANPQTPSHSSGPLPGSANGQGAPQMPDAQMYAMQYQQFHARLQNFYNTMAAQGGSPVPPLPAAVDGKPINLFRFWTMVFSQLGGSQGVAQRGPGIWQQLCHVLEIPPTGPGGRGYKPETVRDLQMVWQTYLMGFEKAMRVAQQQHGLMVQRQQQMSGAPSASGGASNVGTPAPSQHAGSPAPGSGMQGGGQIGPGSVTGTPRESTAGTPGPFSGSSQPQQQAYPPAQMGHERYPPHPQPALQQQPTPVAGGSTPGPMYATSPANMGSQYNAGSVGGSAASPTNRPLGVVGATPPATGPTPGRPPANGSGRGKKAATPGPDKSHKRKRGKKEEESPALQATGLSQHLSTTGSMPPPPVPPSPRPFTLLLNAPPRATPIVTPVTAPTAQPRKVEPTPRKRVKVEYCPLTRQPDNTGGWDLTKMDEGTNRILHARGRRTVDDLGLLDLASLTMSLRSRMASEVAWALNTLNLLGGELRQNSGERVGLDLRLETCDELLDELLDLLEETAFDEEKADVESNTAAAEKPESLRQATIRGLEEEFTLRGKSAAGRKPVRQSADDLRPFLGQTEVVFSVLNVLRAFASSEDSAPFMGSEPRMLAILVGLCGMPASIREGVRIRKSLALSTMDRLKIRRDVLQIVCDVGDKLVLEGQGVGTCAAVLELAAFFLEDGADVPRTPIKFDTSTPAGQQAYNEQQVARRNTMAGHVDAALGVLSRVTLPDANRQVLGGCDAGVVERLIEMLLQMLPLTRDEFADLNDELGLTRTEIEAMALFNLVFLSPLAVKIRLFHSPLIAKTLLRMITPLMGFSPDYKNNPYSVLIERSLEVLHLCHEAARQQQPDPSSAAPGPGSSKAEASGPEPVEWFGGGFAVEEREGGAGGEGDGGSAPPLAAMPNTVRMILRFPGIGHGVFESLVALLEGKPKGSR